MEKRKGTYKTFL